MEFNMSAFGAIGIVIAFYSLVIPVEAAFFSNANYSMLENMSRILTKNVAIPIWLVSNIAIAFVSPTLSLFMCMFWITFRLVVSSK